MTKSAAEHVAKAVASRRFVACLSQAELAAKCGLSRQAIDQIERGQITPSLKTLEALAVAFGVKPSDLLP